MWSRTHVEETGHRSQETWRTTELTPSPKRGTQERRITDHLSESPGIGLIPNDSNLEKYTAEGTEWDLRFHKCGGNYYKSITQLDLRKESLCLIRTVEKLNVCSCGTLLMKGCNSLDSLFTDSRGSLPEEPARQLYNGQWTVTKSGTVERELTVLRKLQSSQIKRPKLFLLTPFWHGTALNE